MLSWLPEELLQRIVQLVAQRAPRSLAILALLDQHSRTLAAARLACMKPLLTAPFKLTAGHIFTASSSLVLFARQLGSKHMEVLGNALVSGALGNLTFLRLDSNQIGDPGMQALAGAVSNGALPQLEKLWLGGNSIGDAGLSALADVVSRGALDHLTVCLRPTALFPCFETW